VPVINKLIESVQFNMVAYSLDWHPEDHLSFVDNVAKRKLHASSKVYKLSALIVPRFDSFPHRTHVYFGTGLRA